MKLTLEQFLEQYDGAIGKIAWKNIRVYKLKPEDEEDLRSELKLIAIAWYLKYYEKFVDQPNTDIASLLMYHMDHRMQYYMDGKVLKHWGLFSLDLIAHGVHGDENMAVIQVPDVRAERAIRDAGLRGLDMKWLTKVLNMLPAEDKEILCIHCGLPGYEDRVSTVSDERVISAIRRLRRAEEAYRNGLPVKFHKSGNRDRIQKTLVLMDFVSAYNPRS